MKGICGYILAICAIFLMASPVSAKTRKSFHLNFRLKPIDLLETFPMREWVLEPPLDGFHFLEGYVGLSLWQMGSTNGTQAGHEMSLYAPSNPVDLDMDWIGSARSTLWFQTDAEKPLSVGVRHGLWYHAYRKGGYYWDGELNASRSLKHQLRVTLDANLSSKWRFSLPLYLQQSHFESYHPEARFNDRWRYAAWAAPELAYAPTKDTSLSVSWETDTFIGSDAKSFYFTDSLVEGEVYVQFSQRL